MPRAITESVRQRIKEASEQEKPLTMTTATFIQDSQGVADQLLVEFLTECQLMHYYDALSYCLRELAINAKKANTKRIYFEERGLNPRDHAQYAEGMLYFKETMLKRQKHYLAKLRDHGFYIKIEFLRWQKWASIAVRNNVEIFPEELERIRDKITRAKGYTSLEDAFDDVMDDLEGAGLGLVVLVLMMRNSGISGDFLHIYPKPGQTVARIIVPLTE